MPGDVEVKSALVAYNPYSTAADRLGAFIASLEMPVRTVQTEPSVAGMQAVLCENANEDDVLVVFTGDGSYETVVSALLDPKLPRPELSNMLCVPAEGGRANNNARSYNKDPLGHVLRHGRVERVHPFEITTKLGTAPENSIIAVSDVSFGRAAIAARGLEAHKPENRKKGKLARLLSEIGICLSAASDEFVFTIVDLNGKDAESADLTFGRIQFFAKLGRLPMSPFVKEYMRLLTKPGDRLAMSLNMGKLALGMLHGEVSSDPTTFTVCTPNGGPIPMQYGGEVGRGSELFTVASGSEITVGLSDSSIRTLTTRRPARPRLKSAA